MKKINYLLMGGAVALTMASCSQDELLKDRVDDGRYHITVKLPMEVATRSLGDGLTADNLYMAVYDADNGNALIYDDLTLNFGGEISTEVALTLAKGKSYNIAFFALSPTAADDKVYNFDSTNGQITVKYENMKSDPNIQDAYDCFFKLHSIQNFSGTTQSQEVLLNRPVAQINWGTNDLDPLTNPAITNNFGDDGEYILSGLTTKAYNTYDFFTGAVAGQDTYGDVVTTGGADNNGLVEVALPRFAAPIDESFPVDGYKYVAMQYLLAPQSEYLYNLTLNIGNGGNTSAAHIEDVVNVDNAPVQANYRTNIYGSLLSEDVIITVTKDKVWGDPDYDVVFINGIPYYVIKQGNQSLIRKGGYMILDEDYNYTGISEGAYLYIDKNTVLDLNGHELSSSRPGTYEATMTIGGANVTNVTISNGTVLPLENDRPTTTGDAGTATIYFRPSSACELTLDNVTVTGSHPVYMHSSNANSKITINSGTYYPTNGGVEAVYVQNGGKVTINGGTFGTPGLQTGYLLNIQDQLRAGQDPRNFIEVYGGTFINFDPSNNAAEGTGTNFVADGYKVVASIVGEDTYYTVLPADAITVDGVNTTMAQALESAKDGDTIFVSSGTMATPVDFNKSVTIKGMGAETSILQANNAYWTSSNGANLTFEDVQLKSFVNNTNHTSMGFNGAGNQTYTNVIFDGEFHVFTGNATFTNCAFNYYGVTGNNYQLWCQTNGTTNINNCSMECETGKAILVTAWGSQYKVGGNININGLTVTTQGTGDKAVVEIHSEDYTSAGTININNVTYTPETSFGGGLWREINNTTGAATKFYNVFVNGQEVQKSAQ